MEGKTNPQQVHEESGEQDVSSRRREFLKKCGRFAVYAAPAMVLILTHDAQKTAAGY